MQFPKNSYTQVGPDRRDVEIIIWDENFALKKAKIHQDGYHQMIAFAEGGGTHEINFETLPIKNHSFHLIPAGTMHMIQTHSKTKAVIINFTDAYQTGLNHFDIGNVPDIASFSKYVYHPVMMDFRTVYTMLLSMAGDLFRQHNKAKLLNFVSVLLLKIISNHNNELDTDRNRFVWDITRRLHECIDIKYKNKPDPVVIAAQLKMTEDQLQHFLKIHQDGSLLQVQRRRILSAAKEMLVKKSRSTITVANDLGFRNEYEFLKFFRKCTKMGPDVYRTGGHSI